MDHVVGGKFKLDRKIGSGSFGELYLGMHKDFAKAPIFFLVMMWVVNCFCNVVVCF